MSKTRTMQMAQQAAEFVKYVLPFGANNRDDLDGDKLKRKTSASALTVDQTFLKVLTEIKTKMGHRPVQSLQDIMVQAEVAIKYGAGNCEQQAAIVFIYLLTLKIFDVRRTQVEKRNSDTTVTGHIFVEFKDSKTGEEFALDPWDNNTIYSISERERQNLSRHTCPRTGSGTFVRTKGASFNFNQYQELLEIEELKCEQIDVSNHNKVAIFFKTFLKKCVTQSLCMDNTEKLMALKKMGINFIEMLDDYIIQRRRECNFSLFGYSGDTKIIAAKKLVSLLQADNVIFTAKEMCALRNARLATILDTYNEQLPAVFLNRERNLLKARFEIEERISQRMFTLMR